MATVEDQVNHQFATQLGFTPQQIAKLRQEFKKFGRNPLGSELEILAIENGIDEQKVKVCERGAILVLESGHD